MEGYLPVPVQRTPAERAEAWDRQAGAEAERLPRGVRTMFGLVPPARTPPVPSPPDLHRRAGGAAGPIPHGAHHGVPTRARGHRWYEAFADPAGPGVYPLGLQHEGLVQGGAWYRSGHPEGGPNRILTKPDPGGPSPPIVRNGFRKSLRKGVGGGPTPARALALPRPRLRQTYQRTGIRTPRRCCLRCSLPRRWALGGRPLC